MRPCAGAVDGNKAKIHKDDVVRMQLDLSEGGCAYVSCIYVVPTVHSGSNQSVNFHASTMGIHHLCTT